MLSKKDKDELNRLILRSEIRKPENENEKFENGPPYENESKEVNPDKERDATDFAYAVVKKASSRKNTK